MKTNGGDFFVSRELGLLEIYDAYQELAKRRGLLANFEPLRMLGEMALGLELLRKRLRKSKALPGMRLTIDETTAFLADQEGRLHPAARLPQEARDRLLMGTDFIGIRYINAYLKQRFFVKIERRNASFLICKIRYGQKKEECVHCVGQEIR